MFESFRCRLPDVMEMKIKKGKVIKIPFKKNEITNSKYLLDINLSTGEMHLHPPLYLSDSGCVNNRFRQIQGGYVNASFRHPLPPSFIGKLKFKFLVFYKNQMPPFQTKPTT